MAFAHSKDSRVFANEHHVSASLNGWTVTHQRDYGETTTIADSGGKFVPGLMTGALALRGLSDTTTLALQDEIQAAVDTDNGLLLTVCPYGYAIGAPALFAPVDVTDYAIDASVSDAVGFSLGTTPDATVDAGIVLHALGAETGDANAASQDNAASSASGGAAVLHVTAYSGLTDAVIKVQHSTDDSVWADLITFTTVTATTSEFATVTGTVNRYVRATVDVTGTGSVTYAVAFARR